MTENVGPKGYSVSLGPDAQEYALYSRDRSPNRTYGQD